LPACSIYRADLVIRGPQFQRFARHTDIICIGLVDPRNTMFLARAMERHAGCIASDVEGHSGPEGHAPARMKLAVHPRRQGARSATRL
jgi:hypothetical protein